MPSPSLRSWDVRREKATTLHRGCGSTTELAEELVPPPALLVHGDRRDDVTGELEQEGCVRVEGLVSTRRRSAVYGDDQPTPRSTAARGVLRSRLIPFGRPRGPAVPRHLVNMSARSRVPDDAAKSDMAGRCVDSLSLARGRAVPQAVVRCTEMGPALRHAARNVLPRRTGVIARVRREYAGIPRHAAGTLRLSRVGGRKEVGSPFPDIPQHIAQAELIGCE